MVYQSVVERRRREKESSDMLITTTLGAALASCAIAGAPAPGCNALVACQIPLGPTPGHEIYSEMLQGAPTNNGNILYPRPYPYNRTDTTTFTNSGRLWVPSTAQQKIFNELYPGDGPASYGAGLDQGDMAFFVRPDSEPWPDVLLSPWQNINEATIDEMIRRQPWLKRSPSRTQAMITELRQAQNEFLRQQGLVTKVRTHVNAKALERPAAEPGKTTGEVEPSGVIRITPAKPGPNPNTLRTSLPSNDTVTRVSLPGDAVPEARITVVRQETEPEAVAGDQG